MMNKVLLAAVFCFSLFQLNAQDMEPSIVGTWKYSGMEGIAVGDEQGRQFADMFFGSTKLTFTEEGTWKGNFMGAQEGTYTLGKNGKIIELSSPSQDKAIPVKIEELTATQLKINPGQSPGSIVLTRE